MVFGDGSNGPQDNRGQEGAEHVPRRIRPILWGIDAEGLPLARQLGRLFDTDHPTLPCNVVRSGEAPDALIRNVPE